MSPAVDMILRVSVVVAVALLGAAALPRRSAALRHWWLHGEPRLRRGTARDLPGGPGVAGAIGARDPGCAGRCAVDAGR